MTHILERWDNEQDKKISIDDFLDKAIRAQRKEELLETTIVGSYTLIDALDGQVKDPKIAEAVKETLKELSPGKFANETAMQEYFKGMIERGDKSVEGVINKLKGTLGELEFKHHLGDDIVRLSNSGSQKGWDLAINRDGVEEYVQVKMYNNAVGVIDKMEEVAEQLKNGEILNDTGEVIEKIDFAVGNDVYQDLKNLDVESRFGVKLYEVPISSEEAAAPIAKDISDLTGWNEFFDQLGLPVTAIAITGLRNAFLVAFGDKGKKEALANTAKQAVLAYVAVVGSHIGEAIALGLCPPLVPVAAIGGALWTRAVVKGMGHRFTLAELIEADNARLKNHIERFAT